MSDPSLLVMETVDPASAACVVCGNEIAPGAGITARYGDRILRFKCPGCLARFRANPDRYLTCGPTSCCEQDDGAVHGSHAEGSIVEVPRGSMAGRHGYLRVVHLSGAPVHG